MEKIIALLIFVLLRTASFAQERTFNSFKVDLGIYGYSLPVGNGAKGGVAYSIEPKYRATDVWTCGVKIEHATLSRIAVLNKTERELFGDVKTTLAGVITTDYYFSKKTFRPFIGVGAGLYHIAGTTITAETTEYYIHNLTKKGFLLRAGTEAGIFHFGLEYNIIPPVHVEEQIIESDNGDISFIDGYHSNPSYMTIKVGIFLGGKRKSENGKVGSK